MAEIQIGYAVGGGVSGGDVAECVIVFFSSETFARGGSHTSPRVMLNTSVTNSKIAPDVIASYFNKFLCDVSLYLFSYPRTTTTTMVSTKRQYTFFYFSILPLGFDPHKKGACDHHMSNVVSAKIASSKYDATASLSCFLLEEIFKATPCTSKTTMIITLYCYAASPNKITRPNFTPYLIVKFITSSIYSRDSSSFKSKYIDS